MREDPLALARRALNHLDLDTAEAAALVSIAGDLRRLAEAWEAGDETRVGVRPTADECEPCAPVRPAGA